MYRHSQLSLSSLPCSTSKGRTIIVLFNVKQLIYKQQGEYVSTLFEQNGYLSAKVNKIFLNVTPFSESFLIQSSEKDK